MGHRDNERNLRNVSQFQVEQRRNKIRKNENKQQRIDKRHIFDIRIHVQTYLH